MQKLSGIPGRFQDFAYTTLPEMLLINRNNFSASRFKSITYHEFGTDGSAGTAKRREADDRRTAKR
jgi:hypothetical protein